MKATIYENDMEVARINAASSRELAEEIGSEIDQLFLHDHMTDQFPRRLVIEIDGEGDEDG